MERQTSVEMFKPVFSADSGDFSGMGAWSKLNISAVLMCCDGTAATRSETSSALFFLFSFK